MYRPVYGIRPELSLTFIDKKILIALHKIVNTWRPVFLVLLWCCVRKFSSIRHYCINIFFPPKMRKTIFRLHKFLLAPVTFMHFRTKSSWKYITKQVLSIFKLTPLDIFEKKYILFSLVMELTKLKFRNNEAL